MSQNIVRRLRPYLFTSFHRVQCQSARRAFSCTAIACAERTEKEGTNDYRRRVAQLEKAQGALSECYPRMQYDSERPSIKLKEFRNKYDGLKADETDDSHALTILGRITSVRIAGSKLVFLSLKHENYTVQAVCHLAQLQKYGTSASVGDLKAFANIARKGDWYSVCGYPHRSSSGELSILASKLPKLLAPSLHQIPEKLEAAETRARNRHVEMLLNPNVFQTLHVRQVVEQCITKYLTRAGFVKVTTPILASDAGGAVARPFETKATEFEGQQLSLRIAPELWLKRLIIGGMDRVFEFGPAFRNEGVDATHNPEFYTCEFYQAFATLNGLIHRTENILNSLSGAIESLRSTRFSTLPAPKVSFKQPFQKLEFIPTLEREMQFTLPDLSKDTARDELLDIFKSKELTIPAKPSLPRLLDHLASHYLEPLCEQPTFIIHHPTCLSPLARDFEDPKTHQRISARAELFIQGREYANMYEEENSPFVQRQKFEQQLLYRAEDEESDGKGEVDEAYLSALEWGLPPTGGWGCGIERLVMLFAGRERIGDVLPFGGLRNVVGLGKGKI